MVGESQAKSNLLGLLYRCGKISSTSLRLLNSYVQTWGICEHEAVLDAGLLSEEDLADALAAALGLPRWVTRHGQRPPSEVMEHLGVDMARREAVFPLGDDGKVLRLVVADPTRRVFLSRLSEDLGRELALAVGTRRDILRAVDATFPLT